MPSYAIIHAPMEGHPYITDIVSKKRDITSAVLKKGYFGANDDEMEQDIYLERVPVGNAFYRPRVHPLFARENKSWGLLAKCLIKHIGKVELYVDENGSNTDSVNMALSLVSPLDKVCPLFGYGLFIIPTPVLAKIDKDYKDILVERKDCDEEEHNE